MTEVTELLNGVVLGLLGGLLLFYSVRTEVPYPDWIIRGYDEPIVRILMFLAVFGLLQYDVSIGVMSALLVIFLHADVSVATSVRHCINKKCDKSYEIKKALKSKSSKSKDTEEKKEGFENSHSMFGRSATQVIGSQIREGTVLNTPFYPLSDPDMFSDPIPGEPVAYQTAYNL